MVNVDANKIGQVIRNIMSNALKFTPENGCISIGVCTVHHGQVQSISETAPGIAMLHVNMNSSTHSAAIFPLRECIKISVSDTGPGLSEVGR